MRINPVLTSDNHLICNINKGRNFHKVNEAGVDVFKIFFKQADLWKHIHRVSPEKIQAFHIFANICGIITNNCFLSHHFHISTPLSFFLP